MRLLYLHRPLCLLSIASRNQYYIHTQKSFFFLSSSHFGQISVSSVVLFDQDLFTKSCFRCKSDIVQSKLRLKRPRDSKSQLLLCLSNVGALGYEHCTEVRSFVRDMFAVRILLETSDPSLNMSTVPNVGLFLHVICGTVGLWFYPVLSGGLKHRTVHSHSRNYLVLNFYEQTVLEVVSSCISQVTQSEQIKTNATFTLCFAKLSFMVKWIYLGLYTYL